MSCMELWRAKRSHGLSSNIAGRCSEIWRGIWLMVTPGEEHLFLTFSIHEGTREIHKLDQFLWCVYHKVNFKKLKLSWCKVLWRSQHLEAKPFNWRIWLWISITNWISFWHKWGFVTALNIIIHWYFLQHTMKIFCAKNFIL